MARRCDRCRTEYESGVDHGGKDYCMTCYVRVRQEEDAKRRKEERRLEEIRKIKEADLRNKLEKEAQQRRDKMRKDTLASGTYGYGGMAVGRKGAAGEGGWSWQNRMIERRDKAEEDKKKREIEEGKLFEKDQSEILARRRAEAALYDDERKKHNWSVSIDRQKAAAAKAKGESGKNNQQLDIAAGRDGFSAGHMPLKGIRPEHKGERIRTPRGVKHGIEGEPALSLEARKGLPVSLSVGQKDNLLVLAGKNRSDQRLAVELTAALTDSKGKKIDLKLEPGRCGIEPKSEAAFSVKFDLPDGAPRGAMAFMGQIKETAIYVDREAAQSDALRMECVVKTPLDLSYKAASASFEREDGNLFLCLVFDNQGESGGILSPESAVSYGKESMRLRAVLGKKAKIRGQEKNVKLKFEAGGESSLEKLTIDISGVDANGKPYKLQKTIKEKKG